MAVHAFNGTLVANTVSTITLTSWAEAVSISVAASPAGTVWVTTDGSTPTVGGQDEQAVQSGTTALLAVRVPSPRLTTVADTTGGTLPSNPVAFSSGTITVKLISSVAAVFTGSLVQDTGDSPVLF